MNNDNVMSREEFTIFTQRTCGEHVGDDEWSLVKGGANVGLMWGSGGFNGVYNGVKGDSGEVGGGLMEPG